MPNRFGFRYASQMCWAIFLLFCYACDSVDEEVLPFEVRAAFYHWKSDVFIPDSTKMALTKVEVSKLYLRFFDVTWDRVGQEAVPVAEVEIDTLDLVGFDIVPVVFIQNKVIKELSAEKRDFFWMQVLKKIKRIASKLPMPICSEIQIDCDWTQTTRDDYFEGLAILRKHLKKEKIILSTTLRLHQYRDRQLMGIPPVDRAILMFYNMGELSEWAEPNSILNIKKALPYLKKVEHYPLPLDFALPVFQWACVFRKGKIIELINGVEQKTLANEVCFGNINHNRYVVLKSTYLSGNYLYKGDEIRLEKVDFQQLKESVALIKKVSNTKAFSLVFYHLEEQVFERFETEEIKEVIQKMR